MHFIRSIQKPLATDCLETYAKKKKKRTETSGKVPEMEELWHPEQWGAT